MMCKLNSFSRRKACIVYSLLLITAITANLFLGGLVDFVLIILFSTSTLLAVIYFLCCTNTSKSSAPQPAQREQAAKSDLSQSQVAVNSDLLIPTKKIKTKRLYYLDNLKSILTAIVVIHHVTMSFSTNGGWYYNIANYHNIFQTPSLVFQIMDQSYFMCLFFFISGYFSPISCDRKGIKLFLSDKFKRLGVPFIAYQLILGTITDSLYYSTNL